MIAGTIGNILDAIIVRRVPIENIGHGTAALVDSKFIVWTTANGKYGVAIRSQKETEDGAMSFDNEHVGIFDRKEAIAYLAGEIAKDDVDSTMTLEAMYDDLGGL